MEINKNDLDTVRVLAETSKIKDKENSINEINKFWIGNGEDYYSNLGNKILENINKDEEFSIFKKIDYNWIIEHKHPLSNFSPKYRNNKQKESNNPNFTAVDLFCGAGGLSLGFIQNGFEISLANDIDESCIKTYIHNHPSIPKENIILGDIDKVIGNIKDYSRFKNIDVIIGGPPCQGFSRANQQRIKDDPRNKLYKYFIQAVNSFKPKVFVMENVRGMSRVENQIKEDFEDIGYIVESYVINAKDFSVPQNRERLIFIGTREKNGSKKIFDDIFSYMDNQPKYYLKDALYNLPVLKASRIKNATNIYDESGGLIIKNPKKSSNDYLNLINNGKKTDVILNGKARYNNDRDIKIYSLINQGDNSTDPKIADIMPYKSRNHIFKDKYYKLKEDDFCKTITAHMRFDCNMYIHPNEARGLTPREAARVQSYPDDYFFLGAYTKTYMQIGNSVPPLLGRAISKSVIKFLRGEL
ncbi:DNA cytosine methyltransferase [Sneathia sanguinegens]|uniref:DNA cytosine methyltransferase n=1 Tax=Sneathia sanguinegens TaxID=40543 RepID=UPI00258FB50A|nr:DNA cytosine methyltransferase [Sneathia sanguinegens]MDU4651922.1 DNA cytosine methyltransferase [Sneathia sanguinegens]